MASKNLAIATCRVSSFKQLESGSLDRQLVSVTKAAEGLQVNIPEDGIWSGSVSSKNGVNYTRKDLREMLAYCAKHKSVKYLIVDEIDRFMRSIDEMFYYEVEFKNKVGVKVWYAEDPALNSDDPFTKLRRAMKAFEAEGSNVERQRKSVKGQTAAIIEGRYPYRPRPGYRKSDIPGLHKLDSVQAPIIKSLLVRIATNLVTPTNALKEYNQSSFMTNRAKLKMDKFRPLITDPYYAGIVEMNQQVKARNEHGLHEPLITIEQHKEIIRIVESKGKNQVGPRKNGNPDFPLDNILHCHVCRKESQINRFVGFNHTNGVTSKIYTRYRCRNLKCKRYLHADNIHEQVKDCFEHEPMTPLAKRDLCDALETVWRQQEYTTHNEITRLNLYAKKIRETISNQVDAMSQPDNESIQDEIRQSITKKKQELAEIETQVGQLEQSNALDKSKFLEFSLNYVDDLATHFFELSREKQLLCKQLVFPAGFWVDENKKVYTPEISELYRLASNKKDAEASQKSLMVRVRRL